MIPPEQSAEFVCQMEDVLEVYQRPYDPERPQVCLDEASKQLVAEVRGPVPAAPGRPAREDYEYERKGTANVFMACEPLAGKRHVRVTERRTALDFAETIRLLVDEWYPEAEKVVLVMDNLNTHKPASLYEAFHVPRSSSGPSARRARGQRALSAGSGPTVSIGRRGAVKGV